MEKEKIFLLCIWVVLLVFLQGCDNDLIDPCSKMDNKPKVIKVIIDASREMGEYMRDDKEQNLLKRINKFENATLNDSIAVEYLYLGNTLSKINDISNIYDKTQQVKIDSKIAQLKEILSQIDDSTHVMYIGRLPITKDLSYSEKMTISNSLNTLCDLKIYCFGKDIVEMQFGSLNDQYWNSNVSHSFISLQHCVDASLLLTDQFEETTNCSVNQESNSIELNYYDEEKKYIRFGGFMKLPCTDLNDMNALNAFLTSNNQQIETQTQIFELPNLPEEYFINSTERVDPYAKCYTHFISIQIEIDKVKTLINNGSPIFITIFNTHDYIANADFNNCIDTSLPVRTLFDFIFPKEIPNQFYNDSIMIQLLDSFTIN